MKKENAETAAAINEMIAKSIVDKLLGAPSWVQQKVDELASAMRLPQPMRFLVDQNESPRLYSHEIRSLMEAVGIATVTECARLAREAGVSPDVVMSLMLVGGHVP
jgi:hypothetical protein